VRSDHPSIAVLACYFLPVRLLEVIRNANRDVNPSFLLAIADDTKARHNTNSAYQ